MLQSTLSEDNELYFYTIKYKLFEESLCKAEMKYLFNTVPDNKFFFSRTYISPSRSAFLKQCVSVIYKANSLDNLVQQILHNNLSYEKFKVCYINLEDNNIPFEERRKIEYLIGYNINGFADVHNPEVLLGITKIDNMWIFGKLENNNSAWKEHNIKPYSYCNALDVRLARSLVNIAVSNDLNSKLVDPCCGIGTVVIEALSMGLNIKGYELNKYVAENANKNLQFFNYETVIENKDMHSLTEKFDCAIVDLPYGLFSATTLDDQLSIIKTTRKIADRAILVTLEDMETHINDCGFTLIDKFCAAKGTFKRIINICA